jgi:hypothetical protein
LVVAWRYQGFERTCQHIFCNYRSHASRSNGRMKHTSVISFSSVMLGAPICPGSLWSLSISSSFVCDTFKAGFLALPSHPSLCTDSWEQN